MTTPAFTLRSFPRAVLHIDGDAFFTSVEQSIHPEWKGAPMVTGKERGIIACASYEAKALGIKRGVQLHEARAMYPALRVVPSDYETYSLYSKRMFDIIRRFTPVVQEHSIDEGFADITGLRRLHRAPYVDIARRIKDAVQRELDLTVSIGLSLSKGLTKLASKYRKPDGLTVVPGHKIHLFLQRHDLDAVWGFGPNTVELLRKHGLRTAYDFAVKPERWADQLLGKVGRDTWHELRGTSVYPVDPEEKSDYATISKCKTFTAPSTDRDFVYAKLIRNVESAFIKLRRHRLRARVLYVGLREKDFAQRGLEAALSRPTSSTQDAIPLIRPMFDRLYRSGVTYRSTMVVLAKLEGDAAEQYDLFEDQVRVDQMREASRAMDEVGRRYGKHALALGTSLHLPHHQRTERDEDPQRKTNLLPGETPRQRIGIPRLDIRV